MPSHATQETDTAQVAWASQPITLDGRLDKAVWRSAPAYALTRPADDARPDGDTTPHEAGTVRFARDSRCFYAAFDFTDRDIVQESDQDQQHHYRTGDVAELFLKPLGGTHYWELYATPNGRKTAFFFPGRGRLGLPSSFTYTSELRVAARVDGTLNDWKREDRGWTAEMAIPLAELAAAGVPLDEEHPWSVLAGRYNYGLQLPRVELSSFPALPETNYHLYERYRRLQLSPADHAD